MSHSAVLSLGPIHLYRYGVAVALGLSAGLWLAYREAGRRKLDAGVVLDICLVAAVAGLAGARAEHVLFNLPYYEVHPGEILRLDEGGLSIHGALVAGGVAVWLVGRSRGLSFRLLADLLAPAAVLGEAIGRIGCDLVGRPTSWPFAIVVDGVRYHNVPLYSSLYLFALFGYLWGFRRNRTSAAGEVFLEYVLWYSAGRFAIEFTRASPTVWSGLSLAQLASLVLAAGAVWSLRRIHHRASAVERRAGKRSQG